MASTGINTHSSGLAQNISYHGEKESAQFSKEKHEEANIDSDSHSASVRISFDSTHRQLRPRHIQLIGIGGTIGTALYVQIGRGLMNGGPGSLFLAFTIWYVEIREASAVPQAWYIVVLIFLNMLLRNLTGAPSF